MEMNTGGLCNTRSARYWSAANVLEPVHREHSLSTVHRIYTVSSCIFPFLYAPPLHTDAQWGSESPQVQSETIASQNAASKCRF